MRKFKITDAEQGFDVFEDSIYRKKQIFNNSDIEKLREFFGKLTTFQAEYCGKIYGKEDLILKLSTPKPNDWFAAYTMPGIGKIPDKVIIGEPLYYYCTLTEEEIRQLYPLPFEN